MDFIQPIAAVALVLALLGGALWALRKRGAGGPFSFARGTARRMEVVERVPLSAQHALHLVRVGERSFVISTSPSSCALVTEVQP